MADLSVGKCSVTPEQAQANRLQGISKGILAWDKQDTMTVKLPVFTQYQKDRTAPTKEDVGCFYGVNPAKIGDNSKEPAYLKKIQGDQYYLPFN